jgi:hypothetical protein
MIEFRGLLPNDESWRFAFPWLLNEETMPRTGANGQLAYA